MQSEEGYVTRTGIAFCAEMLDLTTAEVTAVATFYSMYRRKPSGDYQVGVCTNTLCAVLGGDAIFAELREHLGVGNGETTEDGKITLEHIECNAACDFAPVVMVNWEFFDNQTPECAKRLVDDLRAGRAGRAHPRRPAVHLQGDRPDPGRLPRRARPAPSRPPAAPGPPRWPGCGWPRARARPAACVRPARPATHRRTEPPAEHPARTTRRRDGGLRPGHPAGPRRRGGVMTVAAETSRPGQGPRSC